MPDALAEALSQAQREAQREALRRTWEWQMRVAELPPCDREYRFHPTRLWCFDYAWPDLHLAVELDGFGHHKLSRYWGDVDKFNAAALLGWQVIHVTSKMVHQGTGLQLLEEALARFRDQSGDPAESPLPRFQTPRVSA